MSVDIYRKFVTIVNEGSINKAAQFLHVTQPALTREIHSLEKEYNTRFFDMHRGSRSLKLTAEGKAFYDFSCRIIESDDQMRSKLERMQKGYEGTISISIYAPKTPLIKYVIGPFVKIYPSANFQINEPSVNDFWGQIKNGVSELGITTYPVRDVESWDILYEQKYRLAIVGDKSSENRLKRSVVMPSVLKNKNLVVYRGVEPIVRKLFKKLSLKPASVSYTDSRKSALEMAVATSGWAIISYGPHERMPDNLWVSFLNQVDTGVTEILFKLKNHRLTPMTRRFVDFYTATM